MVLILCLDNTRVYISPSSLFTITSQVQSFCYIAQQREGLFRHFSGAKMDNLTLQPPHYQFSKYLYPEILHLTVLFISVLLLTKLESILNQTMPASTLKVMPLIQCYNYNIYSYTVTIPDEGPCAANNGRCDQMSLGLYNVSVKLNT